MSMCATARGMATASWTASCRASCTASWGFSFEIPSQLHEAVTAWSKFVSTDTKLQRYADAINSIDKVLC